MRPPTRITSHRNWLSLFTIGFLLAMKVQAPERILAGG